MIHLPTVNANFRHKVRTNAVVNSHNSTVCLLVKPEKKDPCNPSPCGPNSQCNNGVCACLPEYQGDPYVGCRPECVLNSDCPRDKACVRNKCADPCVNVCGQNAECSVINHVPMCACKVGWSGDPFSSCRKIESRLSRCH